MKRSGRNALAKGLIGLAATWLAAGLLASCAGRAGDGGTDTNTNWLHVCDDADCLDGDPLEPARGADPLSPEGEPAPGERAGLEPPTTGSCVVGCEALLGARCNDLSTLPTLDQTLSTWGQATCAGGPLLEGTCEGGTRFVWRGAEPISPLGVHQGEVRYFDGRGSLLGLSSFSKLGDPSSCEGVRRWPAAVPCDAPTVTGSRCDDSAGAAALGSEAPVIRGAFSPRP